MDSDPLLTKFSYLRMLCYSVICYSYVKVLFPVGRSINGQELLVAGDEPNTDQKPLKSVQFSLQLASDGH